MIREVFYISGYFKDDKSTFEDYKAVSSNAILDRDGDSVFIYGMSEATIKDVIKKKEDTVHVFVITSYRKAD